MVSQLWQAHECCNERKYTLLITIIAHETWCLAYCLSTSFLTTQKRVALVCIVILSSFFQKTECVQSLINYQCKPLTHTLGTAMLCKFCVVKIPLVRFSTMPYVVLSGERKVISRLSIFSLFLNSFAILADLKSTWSFRIKCWDLLPELSTSASQKVGFVRMPAPAVNTINRRNICSLCWVTECKQEGLQMNLFPRTSVPLQGRSFPPDRLSAEQYLLIFWIKANSTRPFLVPFHVHLCRPQRFSVSLCLSWLQRQNSPWEPVSSCSSSLSSLCAKGICFWGHRGQGRLPLPLATAC